MEVELLEKLFLREKELYKTSKEDPEWKKFEQALLLWRRRRKEVVENLETTAHGASMKTRKEWAAEKAERAAVKAGETGDQVAKSATAEDEEKLAPEELQQIVKDMILYVLNGRVEDEYHELYALEALFIRTKKPTPADWFG